MENEIKILGHSFDDFKHGDKIVMKYEGEWVEGAVSIKIDKNETEIDMSYLVAYTIETNEGPCLPEGILLTSI